MNLGFNENVFKLIQFGLWLIKLYSLKIWNWFGIK